MKNLKGHTIEDVAFIVCTAMKNVGVTAVLSGGGAATAYAPRAYQTRDLDFILHFAVSMPKAGPILDLGFSETKSRGIYSHPDLEFTLEFLPGPLAVGGSVLTTWDTWEKDGLALHIFTPLDCVRDRMAAARFTGTIPTRRCRQLPWRMRVRSILTCLGIGVLANVEDSRSAFSNPITKR